MRYVIDASVAYKWEVNEPDSPKALRLRDDFRRGVHELLAPDIWPVEVANALYTAELKGHVPSGRFEHHTVNVALVGPALYQSTSLLPRAMAVLRRAVVRVGIYDCLYVALAERETCTPVTADLRLLNALPGGPIVPLSSLP
jgi:predicted nucleic acid-binding protein